MPMTTCFAFLIESLGRGIRSPRLRAYTASRHAQSFGEEFDSLCLSRRWAMHVSECARIRTACAWLPPIPKATWAETACRPPKSTNTILAPKVPGSVVLAGVALHRLGRCDRPDVRGIVGENGDFDPNGVEIPGQELSLIAGASAA